MDNAVRVLSRSDCQIVIDLIQHLEDLEDVGGLAALYSKRST